MDFPAHNIASSLHLGTCVPFLARHLSQGLSAGYQIWISTCSQTVVCSSDGGSMEWQKLF